MSLLNWPSQRNIERLYLALKALDENRFHYVKPSILSREISSSQSEAALLLKMAERTDMVTLLYNVTCPNCHNGYNTYKNIKEIPKTTEDGCDYCFKSNLEIGMCDVEEVYQLNERF